MVRRADKKSIETKLGNKNTYILQFETESLRYLALVVVRRAEKQDVDTTLEKQKYLYLAIRKRIAKIFRPSDGPAGRQKGC